jgi:formate C-acetyltransferase
MIVKPSVCLERARYLTESYKETESYEYPYRQAFALDKILANITVMIDSDELLVGRITKYWRGALVLPEINAQWLRAEADLISTRATNTFTPLGEDEKGQLFEILDYWKERELLAMWMKKAPPAMLEGYMYTGLLGGPTFASNDHYLTHVSAKYEKLIKVGLLGIREEIENEIANLDLTVPEDFEKLQYLEAMLVSNKAAMDFSLRYSRLAAELALDEKNPVRKAELLEISRICAKVPAKPADTYYEALQSIVIVWTVINIEGQGNGLCFGRLDQILYPYYKKEKEAGTLTDEAARMLMSMLYIKANGVVNVDDTPTSQVFTGWPQTMNVNIGGIDKRGRDAVNELSHICLDADLDVGLTQNDLVVRISKKTQSSFVIHAIEVAKALRGKIKFMSDETIIQQMLHDGYSLEDARDYVITGCSTVTVSGKSVDTPGTLINLPLCLELALNNGVRRMDGKQLGLKTGNPRSFTSYEELWNAYKSQAEPVLEAAVIFRSSDRHMFAQYRPIPFHSSLFEGPIQTGKDMWGGGTQYSRSSISPSGAPNVGDSLAAIKKVVFEDKAITMSELVDALDANFEGHEKTLKLLSDAPKYGNDIDYADDIVNEVLLHAVEVVTPLRGSGDSLMTISPAALTGNVPLGSITGALPDGRKAGLPLSEGGVSPYQGRNVSGPVATYRSVAKLDHVRFTNGSVFNMRFSPNALKDMAGIKKFEQMLRKYLEEGGFFVQYNIVDTETLRAAQKNPEQYKDLLVRVATYSAYFVELGADLQEDIITRMTQEIN